MNLTTPMVRLRVIQTEEEDAARIVTLRKKIREEKGIDPPRLSFLSWFRERMALVIR